MQTIDRWVDLFAHYILYQERKMKRHILLFISYWNELGIRKTFPKYYKYRGWGRSLIFISNFIHHLPSNRKWYELDKVKAMPFSIAFHHEGQMNDPS